MKHDGCVNGERGEIAERVGEREREREREDLGVTKLLLEIKSTFVAM